jgi:hypothetical protein
VDYALRRLCAQLSPQLFYHNALHTKADVLPAVVRLTQLSILTEYGLHLLSVALANMKAVRYSIWLILLAGSGFQFCRKTPIK